MKLLFIDIENVKPFASRWQELGVTFWEEAGVVGGLPPGAGGLLGGLPNGGVRLGGLPPNLRPQLNPRFPGYRF